DAAELVYVDYEPLPAVVDPEAAAAGGTLLFPSAGSNFAVELVFGREDDFFDGCEVVVSQRIVNQRLAPCPLEVRAVAAKWGDDGRLTMWLSSQAVQGAKAKLVAVLGCAEHDVRVIAPDVGGGFGAKIDVYPEEVLVGWLSRRVGRPLKWVETRSESMLNLG